MARPASRSRRGSSRRVGPRGKARRGVRSTAARRSARAARPRRWGIALAMTAVFVPMLALGAVVVGQAASVDHDPMCLAAARYSDEQLANAATIIAAGHDAGVGERDRTIAVMTALGESSLRNIDYGDWETSGVTNPDGSRTTSIGLFQQQDGWGTREERLDPYSAATLFYRAMLQRVPEPERSQLSPTLVAHRTQVNDDPEHYARYWPGAAGVAALVEAGGELAGCR